MGNQINTLWLAVLATFFFQAANAAELVPLARGPGVSQIDFDAYAEAHGRLTLSSHFEQRRPSVEIDARFKGLLERAQELWLSGSVDSARSSFKELVRLVLEADWREAQRETIHYSFLRLAQSSGTAIERDEWLQRAIEAFPDLKPEVSLFPPPLMESFRAVQSRTLKLAKEYLLTERFAGYRTVLINGRKYDLSTDKKVKLPPALFRITALSDDRLPLTEKVSASQLEYFRIATVSNLTGSCSAPGGGEALMQAQDSALKTLEVLYSTGSSTAAGDSGLDCVRTRTLAGWAAQNNDLADVERFSDTMLRPAPPNTSELQLPFPEVPREKAQVSKRTWLWVGFTALAAGTAYVLYREMNKEAPAPETQVEPVYRSAQ